MIALLLAALCAPACGAADRWYLEPSGQVIRYEDLATPERPLRLRVFVTWIVNGYSNTNQHLVLGLEQHVMKVLDESAVVSPKHGALDGTMNIRLITGERGAPVFQRRGPGARARWVHRMEINVRVGERSANREYEGALLIFRGDAKEPDQLAPLAPETAQAALIEEMLLRGLHDLQNEGILPRS